MRSKDRIDIMNELLVNGSININWAIKNILGFDKKSEYRIFKIKKIFNV